MILETVTGEGLVTEGKEVGQETESDITAKIKITNVCQMTSINPQNARDHNLENRQPHRHYCLTDNLLITV
jgi:hypothetical protein